MTDKDGESDSDTMTVTVRTETEPTPPTADAGPDLEGAPGETVTLQGTGSTNPHGQWWQMAHRWKQLAGPEVTLSDVTKGAPSFTVPADAAAGTVFEFELTVTDKDGESDSDTVTVTVPGAEPDPTPPTADAGSDRQAERAERVSLTGSGASHASGSQALSYQWRIAGASHSELQGAAAFLENAARAEAHFTVPGRDDLSDPAAVDDGAWLDFELTVTDGDGESASDRMRLTVEGPDEAVPTPPEADAGSDVEGKRGEADVVLSGSGTAHADGSQELSYQWRIAAASHGELSGLSGRLADAGGARARFTVPRRRDVSDRSALDDGNWITFELTVTDGDGESASDTMQLTIRGSTWTTVHVNASDATADETAGEISFDVALDRSVRDRVSVDYRTVDGSAAAGTDYQSASGTLSFGPGETRKTVTVTLLDDAIDEGSETFELVLSNPTPAGTLKFRSDAEQRATGTIRNTDPAQAAWLSRFGRAMATGVVDALSDRIDRRAQVRSGSGSTSDLSLLTSLVMSSAGGHGAAGYGADFGGSGHPGGLSGHANTMPGTANGMLGRGPAAGFSLGGPPLGGAGAGAGLLFDGGMPMGPGGQGPNGYLPTGSLLVPGGADNRWTGWARTSVGHFSSLGGGLPLHGQMRMGIFGADYSLGRVLAGVAVAHGRGEGGMTPSGLDRTYGAHSSLTSVHPYVAFDVSEDLTVWGQTGYGRGEMGLIESRVGGSNPEELGAYRTGNGLSMAAVGVRGALPDAGGFQLAVKSDAFLVRTTSDAASGVEGNLAAGEAGVSRLRAALEGSRELRFPGGRTLTPSVEVGVRQDGGDAETGLGLETGIGVVYAEPRLGLLVDATVNLLVAHQDSRYKEWGFTGSVRFDPGVAGRGLSLSVMPSLGSASQGAGRLWAMQDLGGLAPYGAAPFDMGRQFAADVGYGMAGPGGRGTGTPYAGVTQSGMGYQVMRYGWRWAVDQRFNVGVEGARQGGFGGFSGGGLLDGGFGRLGESSHSVQLQGGVSF